MITSDHLIQRPPRSPVAAYQWPRRERKPSLLVWIRQHRDRIALATPADLAAALPLDGGPFVADPFVSTAPLEPLLRARAAAAAA